MSFEKIRTVVAQIVARAPAVRGKGEQATKQALVLPMLDALGYDIWNPAEVCPEYEADFALKKAGQKEKADIAILLLALPRIYIETKSIDELLDGHEGQLARYFNATPSVTLAVLTNGIEWRFYTDTGDPNVMDSQPFHIMRLDAVDQGLDVIARFARPVFSAEAIRDYATELRYTAQMAAFLRRELDLKEREPSEYFVRWILKSEKMYDGVVNANVMERFRPIAKDALTRVIREIVRRSISAMEKEAAEGTAPPDSPATHMQSVAGQSHQGIETKDRSVTAEPQSSVKSSIETTERELRVFAIVKRRFEEEGLATSRVYDPSLRKEVPAEIGYKDTTGYFCIYFQKPAWWIMRVSIEGKKNWVGFNVDQKTAIPLIPDGVTRMDPCAHADFRLPIDSPEDIERFGALVSASLRKAITDRASVMETTA